MSRGGKALPESVVAADWSVSENKRRMVRAELAAEERYLVFQPEPVGDVATLLGRVGKWLAPGGTALVGFDFPIGLPKTYAQRAGLRTWRQALDLFGSAGWERFYEISDRPALRQPFYPLAKKEKGRYKTALANSLGFRDLDELLRRCDRKTRHRGKAECLFFTLGGKQVGRGAIVGWREVLAPAAKQVRFWPFDGRLDDLLEKPGIVICEIYPREAYIHLGLPTRAGRRWSKRRRADRQAVSKHLLEVADGERICLSEAAESEIVGGFVSDDDFDAMVGLLSMLQVVTGQRDCSLPEHDPFICTIEGWIFGQSPED